MNQITHDSTLIAAAQHLAQKMHENEISLYLTGLAASGKTAVATAVARLTGIPVVDSGLPFRLAAYLCRCLPMVVDDIALFDKLLNAHKIQIVHGDYRLFSASVDITDQLQSQEIEQDAPKIAANPILRERILHFLKTTTRPPAIVAARGASEPITSGSLIQIELQADFESRVRRRTLQANQNPQVIKRSMKERDRRDLWGPSRYPCANVIDTTRMTFDETVAHVIRKATQRIDRLHDFSLFRRHSLPADRQNPILAKAWDFAKNIVSTLEKDNWVAGGQCRPRYLLHLSRYSSQELVGEQIEWTPGVFPSQFACGQNINTDLLARVAKDIVNERKSATQEFLTHTFMPHRLVEEVQAAQIKKKDGILVSLSHSGTVTEEYEMRDASLELGVAVEEYLHYLAAPRVDTTHRLVLVEKSTDLPVWYMSFSPNARSYVEPLLWAFGIRMEEVIVATRGYGFPRCPKNAQSLALRMACSRIKSDFPNLKAVLTDINPNWGFSGRSFEEAGFVPIGLKHAPTSFVGKEYTSRRNIDGRSGSKAAVQGKLPLVPTIIMLKSMDTALSRKLNEFAGQPLYMIPRNLYNQS